MANDYADRVREITSITGTGTYDLDGAVTGFQTFVAGIGTTNSCAYCAEDGTDWEVGEGVVTDASPDTLSRVTILASSNSDAAVSWSAGEKKIFVTNPAANVLDNETGTWTPVLDFASPGDLSVVYNKRSGAYHRLGRLIILECQIQTSTFTYTTSTGKLRITGLPFAAESVTDQWYCAATVHRGVVNGSFVDVLAFLANGSNILELVMTAMGVTDQSATITDVASGDSKNFTFVLPYFSA